MTDKDTPKETSTMKPRAKFSLIDLLIVVMIVGVIATIVLPLRQTRNYETIIRSSFSIMETIVKANDAFRNSEEGFGDNAWMFPQLDAYNLRTLDRSLYQFAISDSFIVATSSQLNAEFLFTITDTSIVATTTSLSNTPKGYYFDTRENRLRVLENSRDLILDTWLPDVSR